MGCAPALLCGGGRSGEPARDNFDEAAAAEDASNRRLATDAKAKIAAFLSSLAAIAAASASEAAGDTTPTPDPRKVFIIHGRNRAAKEQVGIRLRAIGLDPIFYDDVRYRLHEPAFCRPSYCERIVAG